jgi:F-type H+-transporting ATPase subunit c
MKFLTKGFWTITPVLFAALTSSAMAQDGAAAAPAGAGLGAAIAIGVAALGGALGQGKLAAAALEGMARNPQAKLVGPMIIGLALVESLVIYALLVAFVKY